MVLAIWGAALWRRLWLRQLGWRGALLEAALGVASSLAVLWAAGFFMTPSLGADGFGLYRMNLDAFFDANRWSWLLPNLPSVAGDYEGRAFPGLGVLALLLLGLVLAFRRLRAIITPRWLPLLLVALVLAVFAVSDKPVLGTIELGTIPLPATALDFASMFRASGRMIWPAAYLVVALAFVLVARRLSSRALLTVAAAAMIVQVADTSRGWTAFELTRPPVSAGWPTPLESPFWRLAAAHYRKIRAIPVRGLDPNWTILSYFAAFHHMASDAAYLGRRDEAGFERLQRLAAAALADGSFEPDAIYILDSASAAIAERYRRPADLLARIDGLIVFARNGGALATAAGLHPPPYAPLLASQ
jgi:hypothetical protein